MVFLTDPSEPPRLGSPPGRPFLLLLAAWRMFFSSRPLESEPLESFLC